MFTGIIESTGTIRDTRAVAGGLRLRIDVGPMAGECALGASVAVDGVCLTVAQSTDTSLAFDVITETLHRSTLDTKHAGDRVNIERALRATDRLDGHFVQGHIDGTAVVQRVQSSSREWVAWFKPEDQLAPFIIPKGSVAIDGASLTIAEVNGPAFSVALIPTTLERTTLASLKAGDRVNIETDVITRTIIHHLSRMSDSGGLTIESLKEAGFA